MERVFPCGMEKGKKLGFCIVSAVRAASIKRRDSNQTSVCKILEPIRSGKVTAVVKRRCCHSPRCLKESGRCWKKTDPIVRFRRAAGPRGDPQEGSAGSEELQESAAERVMPWARSVQRTPGTQGLASDSPAASMRRS